MAEQSLHEHLVISLVIDNSYVAKSQTFCDGLKKMTQDLFDYQQSHPHKERFHLSMTTFGGLEPVKIKSFDEDELQPYECHGFPLLNKALEINLQEMTNHLSTLKAQDKALYKPWLIILSSGVSYESLSLLSQDAMLHQISQTTVFPFLMDDKFLASQVTAMNRLKPFMVIKDHQINALLEWLKMMLDSRLKDNSEVKMRLDKEMLKDWIYL